MTDYNKARSAYNITIVITMDIAFKMLMDGKLTVDEFRRYFNEMTRKYDFEEVRRENPSFLIRRAISFLQDINQPSIFQKLRILNILLLSY